MGTEQKNLDVPMKVTGETVYSIDVRVPGMKWAAVKTCPVYGGDVKSYDFDAMRSMPGVRSAVRFPIPDPALTRGRIFSGGVAVIADTWYQAKTAIDRMPIEWDDSARATRRSTPRTCTRRCSPRSTSPATCASITATWTTAFARAQRSSRRRTRRRICRARAWSPATRPCSSPTTAWTSGSAIRARRRRASAPRRSPASRKQNVYLHMCHLGGGFGRNGNGPQAEQAIMIANANRGTPIHMLWTREEDFIGTTYRAMGVARLQAPRSTRDGWPIALEVRTAMQGDGFGPEASFDVTSRYYVPSYRYSNHTTKFHVPVGTRRGVGQAAHEFYRESFMDELAHAAGKDPYRYRRELIARTNLPLQGRHDQSARHRGRDVGLGHAAAEGHGARDRARGTRR